MLSSKDCQQLRDLRRESDARSRDRTDGDTDRLRTRERLEATLAGLGELEYLRQRQELLVRNVLSHPLDAMPTGDKGCGAREENYLNSEEKLLEENILLLRKQLNCLRRRDAGLISQLQELDRQISDLRLDTEASHDQAETDSRPSSGFYELSDAASGSLSNSSNSVFSECLSSCRSSTCLCSPLDASLCSSDGRLRSADELGSCAECEGHCEDQASGTVRRSLSAPYSPSPVDAGASDAASKYHCDLVARNGSDVYRYPSPLHAVAVQSPMFISSLAPPPGGREEAVPLGRGGDRETSEDGRKAEKEGESGEALLQGSQGAYWPAPLHKRLDGYIYGLLQRRATPLRTSRPRTSINTDPSKSILRQASLCVRQGVAAGVAQAPGLVGHLQGGPVGQGTLRTTRQPCLQAGGGGVGAVDLYLAAAPPPQRQWSGESGGPPALQESAVSQSHALNGHALPNAPPSSGYALPDNGVHAVPNTNSLLKKKGCSLLANKGALSSVTSPAAALPLKDYQDLGSPKANSSPKEAAKPTTLTRTTSQTTAPKSSPKMLLPPSQSGRADRPTAELASLGSSSQSQDEGGHMVSDQYIPSQRQTVKLRKGGGKNFKVVKVKNTALKPRVVAEAGHGESVSEATREKQQQMQPQQHQSGSRKSRLSEEVATHVHKVSRRGASSRAKRIPASIPEGRVLEKQASGRSHGLASRHHGHHGHHHHHGHREAVVAKPKYKRADYRRPRAVAEAPYDEALRRAQRRHRRELIGRVSAASAMYLPTNLPFASPYAAYAGSDSEYSAECASLFHSTVMDTSEDERSNYTTNCFGDSESSASEAGQGAESSSGSDSEESAEGGGLNWAQFGQAPAGSAPHDHMTPAQAEAFVKIKASHHLKKKILRFRSGSLKLMTTV